MGGSGAEPGINKTAGNGAAMTDQTMIERVNHALRAEAYLMGLIMPKDATARLARAALEAIREPTEAMVAAMDHYTDKAVADCFRAMIAAALEERGNG